MPCGREFHIEPAWKHFNDSQFHSIIYDVDNIHYPYPHGAGCGIRKELRDWMRKVQTSHVVEEKKMDDNMRNEARNPEPESIRIRRSASAKTSCRLFVQVKEAFYLHISSFLWFLFSCFFLHFLLSFSFIFSSFGFCVMSFFLSFFILLRHAYCSSPYLLFFSISFPLFHHVYFPFPSCLFFFSIMSFLLFHHVFSSFPSCLFFFSIMSFLLFHHVFSSFPSCLFFFSMSILLFCVYSSVLYLFCICSVSVLLLYLTSSFYFLFVSICLLFDHLHVISSYSNTI